MSTTRLLQSKDVIEVRQKDDTWREGFINKKERNGTYTVFYNDGEIAFNIGTENIRHKPKVTENMNTNLNDNGHKPYFKNEIVEGNYAKRDKWFECKVIASKRSMDGSYTYSLLYLDGNIEDNIPSYCIRPINNRQNSNVFDSIDNFSTKSLAITQSPNSSYSYESDFLLDDQSNNNTTTNRTRYIIGMIVNANFGNSSNFTKGEIISYHSDDTYTVKCLKTDILKRIGFEMLHSIGAGPGSG